MSKSPQWWGRNTSSITWWAWIGKPCRKMTPSYSMCWNGNDAIVTRMPRRIRTTPIDVPLRNTCWPWSTHMMSRHTAKGRRTWPFSTICCSSMTNHKAAKICHFGRKSNSLVTKTTIKEMLGAKRQETPMEVSDGDKDVVPFEDLASYRCQDELREKVLTTEGLLQCQHTNCQVK